MNFGVVVTLFWAAILAYTADATTLPDFQLSADTQTKLARVVSVALLQGFQRKVKEAKDGEISQTVLPPLPDPVTLDDLCLTVEEDSGIGELIFGNLSIWDSSITGLSTVKDNFELNLITTRVTFTLNTGSVSIQGDYDIDVVLNSGGQYNVTGLSSYLLQIVEGMVDLDVKLFVNLLNGKFSITNFSFDLGFEEITIDLGDALINGEGIEWEIINKNINYVIKAYLPYIKNITDPLIKDTVNELVKDCNFYDFIGGDLSCLGIGEEYTNSGILSTYCDERITDGPAGTSPATGTDPSAATSPAGNTGGPSATPPTGNPTGSPSATPPTGSATGATEEPTSTLGGDEETTAGSNRIMQVSLLMYVMAIVFIRF